MNEKKAKKWTYEIELTGEQLQKLNELVDFEIEDSYDLELAIKSIIRKVKHGNI